MNAEAFGIGMALAMLTAVLWALGKLRGDVKSLAEHLDVTHEDVCELIDLLKKPASRTNGKLSQYLDSMEGKE